MEYKLALEKAYWRPAWKAISNGWKVEIPLILAGAVVAGAMEWPDALESVIRGLIGGGAVLFLIVIYQICRFAFSAPYRLWKQDQEKIKLLEQSEDKDATPFSIWLNYIDEAIERANSLYSDDNSNANDVRVYAENIQNAVMTALGKEKSQKLFDLEMFRILDLYAKSTDNLAVILDEIVEKLQVLRSKTTPNDLVASYDPRDLGHFK